MAMTSAEIAARIAASANKRPPHEKIDNTERLGNSGLRVVHILPHEALNAKGLTMAWRPSNNSSVIQISTAVCKRGDVFSRKMGTRTAIENYEAGRAIYVPLVEGDPVLTARVMFGR